MQIGHSSSAQNVQRVTFLLTELIMIKAEQKVWGIRDTAEFLKRKQWIAKRNTQHGHKHGRIFYVLQYQEDLFVVVIGLQAAVYTKKRSSHIRRTRNRYID